MIKIFFYGLVFMLLISCKENQSESAEGSSTFDVTTKNWPKKSKVNSKASLILKEWSAYVDLDTTFDGLYTVENTEDLSLIIGDLLDNQKSLAKSVYPKQFDDSQIKSRQKVFHTFLLKTKGDLEYRLNAQESMIAMITAYNSLRHQFEIITNNTLDIQELLED